MQIAPSRLAKRKIPREMAEFPRQFQTKKNSLTSVIFQKAGTLFKRWAQKILTAKQWMS